MDIESKEIKMLLQQKKSEERKTISINIDECLLNQIDEIVAVIGKSKDTFCSRNTFIEVASQNYLEKIRPEVDKLNFIAKKLTQPNNQVIIFTSSERAGTYQTMFLNNHWSCVPLGNDVVDLINNGIIKYFALYRGKPHQFIESYAEILSINRLQNGKYEFELGKVQYLPQPVLLGSTEPSSLMKGRRTTLSKLLSASTINQL